MKTLTGVTKLNDLINYHGIDASNEISLFEYGILFKESKNEITVIFGVGIDNGGYYNRFDSILLDKSYFDEIIQDSWFNKDSFFSFCGINNESEYFNLWIGHKIDSLLSYYGYENIFGSSYNTFEIENN